LKRRIEKVPTQEFPQQGVTTGVIRPDAYTTPLRNCKETSIRREAVGIELFCGIQQGIRISNVQDAKFRAIQNGNTIGGWGEGLENAPEAWENKRLDFGESGSNLEDVDNTIIIPVPHRRHDPERSVVHPEVWVVS